MGEKSTEKMQNFPESKIKEYLEILEEIYEKEACKEYILIVYHHETTKVDKCQYLLEMGYVLDLDPMSSLFNSGFHKYILTERGRKFVESARANRSEHIDLGVK
jgi:hypothetical protein